MRARLGIALVFKGQGEGLSVKYAFQTAFPCIEAEIGLSFKGADKSGAGKAVDGVLQGAEVQFWRIDAFAFLPNQRAGKGKVGLDTVVFMAAFEFKIGGGQNGWIEVGFVQFE